MVSHSLSGFMVIKLPKINLVNTYVNGQQFRMVMDNKNGDVQNANEWLTDLIHTHLLSLILTVIL